MIRRPFPSVAGGRRHSMDSFRQLPEDQGLYSADQERDACGVGFLVNIDGTRSNSVVRSASTILCNMIHRGGNLDQADGDGAGVYLRILICPTVLYFHLWSSPTLYIFARFIHLCPTAQYDWNPARAVYRLFQLQEYYSPCCRRVCYRKYLFQVLYPFSPCNT